LKYVRTILIEEPEVHLHPTALRNFARQLSVIAKEEQKQIIFTTHSELFLSSLLAVVAEGRLTPEEIRCYLTTKEGRKTIFEEQKVQQNGQIEGGLTTFVEAELEDLKKMLRIR
jgi:predicted ATPase